MSIFVVEGVNGAGKSTVGHLVERAVRDADEHCMFLDPASHGALGEVVRDHLLSPNRHHTPDADALLFATLRVSGLREIIGTVPADMEAIVILERWSLALAAYGAVDGVRSELINEVTLVLSSVAAIDHTILLDVPGEVAHARLQQTESRNRFEIQGAEYLEEVAAAYRRLALESPGVSIVDASGSVEATVGRALESLRAGSKASCFAR